MRTRPLRRTLPVVALALVLVAAGCSLPGGDGDPSPTDANATTSAPPAPTETPTESPTETPDAADIAGVEDGRLVDPGALADAHRSALVADGFETRRVRNATVVVPTGPNGTDVARTTVTRRVVAGADARPYRYRLHDSGAGFALEAWGNDSAGAYRTVQSGEVVQTRVADPEPAATLASRDAVADYLRAGNFSVTDTATENGTTLVTLEADALAVENDTDLFVAGSEDYRDYRSTVVVDGDGVVRSVDLSATYSLRGERYDLSASFAVLRRGDVSVERPDWATRALARATETEEPVRTDTPA